MSVGRKDYMEHCGGQNRRISSDDPCVLEALAERLRMLESETSRNSAEISRVKKRIAQIRRIDRMPHKEQGFPGGWLRTNEELNSIQFFFDLPPDRETVRELERLNFRWSKKDGAWQSPRTPKYLRRAEKMLDYIVEPFMGPCLEKIPTVKAIKLAGYLQAILEALE